MIDLGGEAAILGVANPLEEARAVVPVEVRVEGDSLLWCLGPPWEPGDPVNLFDLRGFREGGSVAGALWAFVDLIDAEPEAVAAFARRYGVLALGANGRPSSAQTYGEERDLPSTVEGDDGVSWYSEPAAAYRLFAVALRAMLAFGIAARGKDAIDSKAVIRDYGLDRFDWDTFGMPETYGDDGGASGLFLLWLQYLHPQRLFRLVDGRASREARDMLSRYVSRTWLAWASLRPIMTWQDEPRLTLDFGDPRTTLIFPAGMAFSVIVGQALAVLTSPAFERLALCAVCGRLYQPAIKPGRHTVAYCSEHKLEGDRARKRKWAQKKARERRDSDSQKCSQVEEL